ncbi:hypothetical protein HHK36_008177 [Tetracentron sinense]|uniref:Uncharacterized protein n=1 Tax=Tetracentron sinense TaxID=13715 RepID=A0A835DMY7_TETSI|nr:hypothetical protein HHK36_008177 [Tetracentron sinense]
MVAEEEAIREGPSLANSKRWRRITIESYLKALVEALSRQHSILYPEVQMLLDDIVNLANLNVSVTYHFVNREANSMAHDLDYYEETGGEISGHGINVFSLNFVASGFVVLLLMYCPFHFLGVCFCVLENVQIVAAIAIVIKGSSIINMGWNSNTHVKISGEVPLYAAFPCFVLDPAKCSQLSLEEKRELVHEIAQCSDDAPEMLRSWSRRELLEIICAEMGKERKYTGFTKIRMIEHLLKLVLEKPAKNNTDDIHTLSPVKTQTGSKRPRKKEHPLRLATDSDHVPLENSRKEQFDSLLCQNLACRATLSPDDAFCKRCSCCICYHFDDNKDPSLWLTCSSDPPDQNDSCGMSCHLKCALKHERAGIVKNGCYTKLDGSFYCISCRKVNGLMRTCRKQLLVAKEARRVDILCLRISLSRKILKGTEQYKELQRIVDTAAKKLKKEVGPLDRVCTKMARGIVNRLPCGAEVQKLCASAVEALDFMLSGLYCDHSTLKGPPSCRIRFEEASPTSVVIVLEYEDKLLEDFVGCRLWHRRSTVMNYPENPTCIVLRPEKRFMISSLNPSTEYFCKISMFSSTRVLGIWEAKWVTETQNGKFVSDLDEEHGKEELVLMVQANSQKDSTNSSDNKFTCSDHHSKLRSLEDISKNDESHLPPPLLEVVPLMGPTSIPPSTPCKSDGTQDIPSSGGKKQLAETERDYEYSVRVIRWLEREGHIEKDFRVKFLTWFSLKATMQERRVVSAFVDTLIDDPPSLADQLVDTFMDEICNEKKPVARNGFCTRLWH